MNTYRIKRKSVGIISAVITFVMMAFFCFVGCAQTYNGAGKFTETSITLSVGEEFDPSKLMQANISLKFESEDERVLSKTEGEKFLARNSGQTALVALHDDNIIDVLTVFVREQFKVPTNIKMNNNGLITWDESVVVLNGETVRANYKISLEKDGKSEEIVSQTNSYQLTERGSFKVKVKAERVGEILESDFSQEQVFNFALNENPKEIVFNPEQTFGSQKGTLAWNSEAENYDLIFDGIEKQAISGNSYVLDFTNFGEDTSTYAEVIANNGDLESKSSVVEIQKITTPNVYLENDELVWGDVQNATDFVISYSSTNEQGSFVADDNSSLLEGLAEGVYQISYQALAQQNFANGNVKSFGKVAKVGNVETEYEFLGNTLQVTFSTRSQYNRKIVVTQNGKSQEFILEDYSNGEYFLAQSFDLIDGENVFLLQTFPTYVDGRVVIDGISVSSAVKSDEIRLFSAYNVGEINNLHHNIENDESVLTFDNVAFANTFDVYVNDIKVQSLEVLIGESATKILLGKLSSDIYGDSETYIVKLFATREAQENQIATTSQAEKTLTRLKAPKLANRSGSNNGSQTYSWETVLGAKYEYALYTTTADYDLTQVEPIINQTNNNFIDNLSAGYYVLQVKSVPVDNDLNLESEDYEQDNFYVALPIEQPSIKLNYSADEDCYVLTILSSEFAYEYKISLNSDLLGSVFNANQTDSLTYKFDRNQKFDLPNEDYVIEVEAVAQTEDEQRIHTSSVSTISLQRLQAPTEKIVEDNGEFLTVKNTDENAVLVLTKDATKIARSESGKDAKISLDDYSGSFSISAKLEGYQSFDDYTTNGTIKLESETAKFDFYRSSTPTNLYFNQQNVYFSHQTQNNLEKNYVVEFVASSDNGSSTVYVEKDLTNVELQEFNFNVLDLLQPVLDENAEFASHFNQMTSLKVKLYSKICQDIEGVTYLPSNYATLKYNDKLNELEIQRLEKVKLNYNDVDRTITWDAVDGDNISYYVYYNLSQNENKVEKIITSIEGQTAYSFSLNDYDFITPNNYEFYVVAVSDNAFDSLPSSKIIVQKISPVEKLNVFVRDGKYMASFELKNMDLDKVSSININGFDYQIVATEFELSASGEHPTVNQNDEVVIKIFGKAFEENGDATYYISSEPSTFVLREIYVGEFEAQIDISQGAIKWQDFALSNVNDWSFTAPLSNNVRYELRLLGESGQLLASITNITTNSLSLDNETLLNILDGTQGTIQIYAYVNDFGITQGGRGYFGKVLIGEGVLLKKLNSVTNLSAEVDESETTIDDELEKTVNLTWDDELNQNEVAYGIYVNDMFVGVANEKTYAISQDKLSVGKNTISVVATSETQIASSKVNFDVWMFAKPNLDVTDDGVLTISETSSRPSAGNGYIIEMTIGDNEPITIYSGNNNEIGLQPYINGASGDYKIQVIARATNYVDVAVPCGEKAEFSGIILSQPTFTQKANGLTLASADTNVVFYVVCEEKDFKQRVSGYEFNYPDDWDSGEYSVLVYAVKNGCITSWRGDGAKRTITITRIDNTPSVSFQRTEDYNDYVISWTTNEDAIGYSIEVIKNDETILTSEVLTGESINLSQFLNGEVLPSGDMTFVFRTYADYLTDSLTNSLPLKFNVTKVENTVGDISVNDELLNAGYLTYTVGSDAVASQVEVEDIDGNVKRYVVKNSSPTTPYNLRIEGISGNLNVKIRILATETEGSYRQSSADGTIKLDSDQSEKQIYKTLNISNVEKSLSDGMIKISFPFADGYSNSLNQPKFYAEHNGQKAEIMPFSYDQQTYSFYAPDIAEIFAVEDGEFVFNVAMAYSECLLSDDHQVSFEFKNADGSVVAVKGGDEREDFLLVKAQDKDIKAIIVRSTEKEYFKINIDDIKGYWVTPNGETVGYFSKTQLAGANNEACFGINVGSLLKDFEAGQKNLQVAYVYDNQTTGFSLMGYSGAISYTKLVAPDSISIDLGNLAWSVSEGAGTAFLISFEGETSTQEIKVYDVLKNYYLGEDIPFLGTYTISIQNVSSLPQTLASNKVYVGGETPQQVEKIGDISGLTFSEGVLSLNFTGAGELANDINSISNATQESLRASVNALLNKTYKKPFYFKLKDLPTIMFNLRFVNKQGQKYTTTVSATNLLTGFDTIIEGFEEGDRMFNKSIIDGLESILADLPNGTTEKTQLNEIYLSLTDESRWTGVANEDLLFDEIGNSLTTQKYEKISAEYIQAGVYDLYIQQEGSAEQKTLSSNYSSAISDVEVESSPMTRTGVTSDDIYYIDFQVEEPNNGYTLVIRHDEEGDRITETVKIAKVDGVWKRTAVGGAEFVKELEEENVDGRIFVKITLNDEGGLRQELNSGVGASNTRYTFNIYANGDGTTFNSKTEEIDVYFFGFNYNTLRLNSGVFYWNVFKIELEDSIISYSALVKYKLEKFSEQNQTISTSAGQTSQSYNPSRVGNYEYIEFSTPGWKENYSIYVSSPVYRIENLTKLSPPSLTTQNGKILLTDTNVTTRENRTFVLRNNSSPSYSLPLTTGELTYLHTPGLNGMTLSQTSANEYYYRLSENDAKSFYASLSGDTVNQNEFVMGASSQFNRFLLTVERIEDRIYLQSSEQSISSRMIDYNESTEFEGISMTDSLQIIDGKVVWNNVKDSASDGYKILYEVTVETYYKTSGSWTKDDYCTRNYYTSKNYLESSLFVDSVASEQKYVIYVRANVFENAEDGEIVSLENERFSPSSQVSFADDNGLQILNGELVSNYTFSGEDFFEKTKKIDSLVVKRGELSWSYSEPSDLKTKFIVEYSVTGLEEWLELLHEDGEISKEGNTYSFTPRGDQLSSDSAYNFRVSVVNYQADASGNMTVGGELRSNLTRLGGQINVLRDMQNDYFSTSRENDDYKIDFQKYYDLYPNIARQIELEITFKNETGETIRILEASAQSKQITVTEFVGSSGQLEFSVKPISLSPSYLSAQRVQKFELSETYWFEADKVEFDELSQTFSWTYGAVYQYKAIAEAGENAVKVYYNNGTEFLPYGVRAGETVQVFADEEMQGKLPIYYNENVYYVDLSKASYSFEEGADKAYVTILEDTKLLSWTDNQFVQTEINLAEGDKYEFAQKYFVVKKQLLDDTEEKVYFVPLSAVAFEEQRFTIKTNGVVYLDEEFSAFKGIEAGSLLNISSTDTPDNGYYTLNDYFGNQVYVHVSNVERNIVKDENVDTENILFRVEIKSQHDVVSQGVTTSTTTTRVYENISIEGENEAGIFTATFEPNLIGTILSFTVQVYRGKNNLLSEPLQYSEPSLSFNLFSSGDGSEENPYIIEEEQDFENISYRAEKKYYHNEYYQSQTVIVYYSNGTSSSPRTSEGQVQDNDQYYSFKQNQDLAFEDVNGFVVDQAFKGNYDGNNKTISISFATTDVIDSLSFDIQGATVNFERGASLFREITTDGNIRNINLNVGLDYTTAFKDSCTQNGELKSSMLAGLSVKNNGTVSGVTVVAVQVNFETNISGNGSRLAFAGIVGKNEGSMSNCVSQANVQIRQSANPNGTQNFVFSPITIFNEGTSASMSNCRNIGNILVNWRITSLNDNSSILVSGVVVSNRYGSIELCYNTGAISAKTFVGSSSSNATVGKQTYATGVVLYQQGGSLLYASNAGTISAGNAGGIAYSLSNVRIANIVALGKVDTGSSSMFNYLIAKEIIGLNGQTIFTHVVSPSGLENVELISADRVITCGNTGWSIYVDYSSSNVHSVQYVKN